MNGHITVCLVVLAELSQVVEGAAGLAALRLGQFDAEVVVVFVLLEADDIGFQGVKQRAGRHFACLSAFLIPSLTLPLPRRVAMAMLSASR